ncbi:PspC domain-containing protein [Aestuariivivens sediminicola]|uniref:PspC domain-containing protein n=1 Tax=Aestuariivivens sediminicola TaxID=2913560 RepID=UPI001F561513|nr:PspC domain-containing protein [Aestuariivivens sediminicola]
MNKTVNINLAGIFFHIDEDAYLKLQRYLEAIKRSFTDSQGRSEIIADIESRIAELFSERVQHDKQVIRLKEVDEIIAIMGQPEDYLVDDEIFEDDPKTSYRRSSSPTKKLYRDMDNSYIGGVSSGLGHYLGIDALWIRLLWILLSIGSGGTFIFIYILFWVLVPEAKTTAEKLMMTGEPVNISNIEKKIKDGFDNVTDTVSDVAKNVKDSVSEAAKNVSDVAKNVDVKKQASSIKSSSRTFFDTLGEVILFFFKVFAKFIGILLMIIGASTLIGLIIGLFSIGVADIIHIPGLDIVDIVNAGETPVWLISLLTFFAVGIPFFFLFYLGLKILINNLKSIGNIAKFTLLGVWLISVIGLVVAGIRQASEHAFDESVLEKKEVNIKATDTLYVKMLTNDFYNTSNFRHSHGFRIGQNENGEKTIYSSDVTLIVRSTTDSIGKLIIDKNADGRSYEKARERAKNINYTYTIDEDEIYLGSFLTTDPKNKFSDQEVTVVLYLPEGTIVNFSKSTKSVLHFSRYNNTIVTSRDVDHYLKILDSDIECLDCPEETFDVDVDINDDNSSLKINDEGVEVKVDSSSLSIKRNAIKGSTESVKVDLDSDGLSVKSVDE